MGLIPGIHPNCSLRVVVKEASLCCLAGYFLLKGFIPGSKSAFEGVCALQSSSVCVGTSHHAGLCP
eukprot:1023773-Amphidinium_carterae.3